MNFLFGYILIYGKRKFLTFYLSTQRLFIHVTTAQFESLLYFLFLTFGAGENHHQPDLWGWHGFKAKFHLKKLWIEDTITKPVLWSFWYMWSSFKPCNPTGPTSACHTLLRNIQRLPKPKSLWSDLRASSMLSVIIFSMPQTQATWRLFQRSKRGSRRRTPNQEANDFPRTHLLKLCCRPRQEQPMPTPLLQF